MASLYNGQDATVLLTLARPIHDADRSRIAMPKDHPTKSAYYDNIPSVPDLTHRQLVRFWASVEQGRSGECWLWVGLRNEFGYGRFRVGHRRYQAHRVAFTLVKGAIPRGLVIDHLCRNPSCVNPDHLEPVTQRANTLRGTSPIIEQAMKMRCVMGHEFTPENTRIRRGRRECRQCVNAQLRDQWKRGARNHGPNNGNG